MKLFQIWYPAQMNGPEQPQGEIEYLTAAHLRSPKKRRRLPIILFVLTCFSTFIAGALYWTPAWYLGQGIEFRRCFLENWQQGLIYMGTVLTILFFHEMGHFLAARRHRVPASYPFFIPFPISPIGTMGAVIGMRGNLADRRQLFDIGIAGPLAGLFVAIPLLLLGIKNLDMSAPPTGMYELDCPYIVDLLLPWIRPDLKSIDTIAVSQLNAVFMAAWVGLLITGLNMMPVSQLDGGHVVYTLFLKRAHIIARVFLMTAILYAVFGSGGLWSVMIILVILLGTDHPPTANDRQPLGWFRTTLGYASLAIPILCFPIRGVIG